MVKHTQTICRQKPTNCFVGLSLKGLKNSSKAQNWSPLRQFESISWSNFFFKCTFKRFLKFCRTLGHSGTLDLIKVKKLNIWKRLSPAPKKVFLPHLGFGLKVCKFCSHYNSESVLKGPHYTKTKFSITDFFSKCYQIHCFLQIWSHLLKKPVIENFIFYAVAS